jgi:hypothetical protein
MNAFRKTSGLGLAISLLLATGAGLAAERLNMASEGGVKDWQPAPGETPAVPAYPSVVADKSDEVCVNVGYMLERDGSTSNHTLLKAWSAKHPAGEGFNEYVDPFARNALAAVGRWKFAPVKAGSTPRAIYTSASFAFSTNTAADQAALRANCAIPNLRAFVQKAQAEAYGRGDLTKGELERDRQNNPVNPYRGGAGKD